MFVIPLANATSDNQLIDEELLNNAEDAIDDLNMEDLDFEDFNKRLKWLTFLVKIYIFNKECWMLINFLII